jgi:mRNA interferase YafQ
MTAKYTVKPTSKFRKQYTLAMKRGLDISLLDTLIIMLATGVQLPPKYRDHPLRGKLNAFRECHIKDDWVLVYRFYEDVLVLSLSETGTHSDLFE